MRIFYSWLTCSGAMCEVHVVAIISSCTVMACIEFYKYNCPLYLSAMPSFYNMQLSEWCIITTWCVAIQKVLAISACKRQSSYNYIVYTYTWQLNFRLSVVNLNFTGAVSKSLIIAAFQNQWQRGTHQKINNLQNNVKEFYEQR